MLLQLLELELLAGSIGQISPPLTIKTANRKHFELHNMIDHSKHRGLLGGLTNKKPNQTIHPKRSNRNYGRTTLLQ